MNRVPTARLGRAVLLLPVLWTGDCVPAALIPNGWNSQGSMGLNFSLDLDLWGKNRAALRAANADADAAHFELHEAELALTTGIAATYADLASLYARRDSLQSALGI